MKIVIVNHYAGGPHLGMEFRPYYLAKEWLKTGHQVMIIGASFSHLRSKQPQVNGAYAVENFEGIQYLWLRTNTYSGNGLGRIVSMWKFVRALLKHGPTFLKEFKPDLIIASSTYPLDNIAVKSLAKKFKAKACYEVHDLWPLSPMELGGYSKNHPFIRVMQYGEDFGYKHSDFVVSMLPKTFSYMVSRGMKPEKFIHIPNGISFDEWYGAQLPVPETHHKTLSEIKNRYSFLVGYTGGHSISNSLGALVRAGKIISSDIAIVLIGDGLEKKTLEEIASSENIKNVYFLPPVSKRCIPLLLTYFDALFIGAQKQSLYRFGISPNKMFDYMMVEKPIVQAIDAGNNMVKEYRCGIDVEPENPEAIASAIMTLYNMPAEQRRLMGKNGRAAVEKFHDYKVLAQQFIDRAAQN